jgi:hypothetical protein
MFSKIDVSAANSTKPVQTLTRKRTPLMQQTKPGEDLIIMSSDSEVEQNLSSALEIINNCTLGKRDAQPGRRPGQDGNPEQSTSPVQKKKTPIKRVPRPEELKEEEDAPKKNK